MQRYIFTDNRPTMTERIANIVGPIILGLVLAALALAYFDILTY